MRAIRRIDIERGADLLRRSRCPAILIGPGAAPAMPAIAALARALGAPVLTTPDAKSLFDETSPHAGGAFSFGAAAFARSIVAAADLVLAIGTALHEFASDAGRAFDHATLVHVSDDPCDIPIGMRVAAAITGAVGPCARELALRLQPRAPSPLWFEALRPADGAPPTEAPRSAPMRPVDAVRALGDALPARARLVCDITSAALHVLREMTLGPDRRLLLQIERSACMASALSMGLGVRLASDLPTLVVVGDWGFLMGTSELHTAASLGVDRFVVVVISNGGGALIRAGVLAQGLDVPRETHSFAPARFALSARACGVRALTVRSAARLRRAAAVAMRASAPVLIDAVVDPDAAIPGAGDRFAHLDRSETLQ